MSSPYEAYSNTNITVGFWGFFFPSSENWAVAKDYQTRNQNVDGFFQMLLLLTSGY